MDAKGAKRSIKKWTTNFSKRVFKNILLYMNGQPSKIGSVHFIPRTIYFDWICMYMCSEIFFQSLVVLDRTSYQKIFKMPGKPSECSGNMLLAQTSYVYSYQSFLQCPFCELIINLKLWWPLAWVIDYKALESWILRQFSGWRYFFYGHFWKIRDSVKLVRYFNKVDLLILWLDLSNEKYSEIQKDFFVFGV